MDPRRVRTFVVVLLMAGLASPGLRAQEAAEMPPAFRDAVAALDAEETQRALDLLGTLDDSGELAGRIHYARAVAHAQQGWLGSAACAWSRAVQEEPDLAGIDPGVYPHGDELAVHLGLGNSLPEPPDDVEWTEPVPAKVRVAGLYTAPVTDATETGSVQVDGVVLPDGRYVVRRVETEDPALARFVLARACRWTFEPATVGGEPVAMGYRFDLGSARDLVATFDRPLELEIMELPERLASVREHLLAGRWRDALDAAPGERWIYHRSRRDVALYYFLRSMAHERLGATTDAFCDRSKVQYLLPEIASAQLGSLPRLGERPRDDNESGSSAQARGEVRQVGGEVIPPKKLSAPHARYTESLRKRRVQGVVIVQAIIGRSGRMRDLKVIKADDSEMGLPALDALCRWTFEPATLDGEPVAVYYNLTVAFRLSPAPRRDSNQ